MSGLAPREKTDAAIDCALHGLPEPQNGWRELLPPETLGSMVDAGSGQIGLQGLVASLRYGPRPYAVRTLNNYADLCQSRFMLSEPWSWIYASAIVSCWAATVQIAEAIGERELARKFRRLLATWAGTCALMEVRGRVLMAGCRGWGHEIRAGGSDDLWAIAAGRKDPERAGSRKYGTPGATDNWGWIARCARVCLEIFRSEAAPYLGRDWRSLLPSVPRWGARTEFQLLGWEDGSRLCIMGDDEPGFDDEDQNSNTPGILAAGVLNSKVVVLPKWPNPYDGEERIRQTNCRADIDGDPTHGWTLFHSHLGERKLGDGYTTDLPAYAGSPLAFWVLVPAGETVWQIKYPGSVVHPPDPVPNPGPVVPAPGKKPRKPCPCVKLWRKLRGKR